MEFSSLENLIESIERGTNLHICVAFLDHFGNRKTLCRPNQTIHDRPVCLAIKNKPGGMASCYRCRMGVQNAIIRRKRSMAGFCTNGVFEYCRPVIYKGQAICALFIGNILTRDPKQRARLEAQVGSALLSTMEQDLSKEDCEKIADLLESYILFLFEHYGSEARTFDPLIENIKSHIQENIAIDFSLEELAAIFHYSPKYLGRLFKMRTGSSVKTYCNRIKIDYAKSLLIHSDLSIDAIAAQSGFNSINYFDRVFDQIAGCSPKSYRKQKNKKG